MALVDWRLHCVTDSGVPEPTTRFLRDACDSRRVEYVTVDPGRFDFDDARRLGPGDLIYRPATSMLAIRVEQFLLDDGVGSFYRSADAALFTPSNSTLIFERAGLPIPRTIYCGVTDRDLLEGFVRQLGGFPVIVKVLGFSRGIGVMRADSLPALFSLVDYAVSQGHHPLLTSYIDEAVHWRLVVVGARVVAAYRNTTEPNDFRTYAGEDPDDYTAEAPDALVDVAVGAVDALGLEFGGVDILEHPSGRLYLLEANFPCYFATAQEMAGIDVAGPMVDYLLAKAKRLHARIV